MKPTTTEPVINHFSYHPANHVFPETYLSFKDLFKEYLTVNQVRGIHFLRMTLQYFPFTKKQKKQNKTKSHSGKSCDGCGTVTPESQNDTRRREGEGFLFCFSQIWLAINK